MKNLSRHNMYYNTNWGNNTTNITPRNTRYRGTVVVVGGLILGVVILLVLPIANHTMAYFFEHYHHYRPKLLLRVNNNNKYADDRSKTFRILQLTDLHLGEAPFEDWGPKQDVKTLALLRDLFAHEHLVKHDKDDDDDDDSSSAMIDLVIFSGDQLTGNDVDANATLYYDWLGQLMEEMALPYVMIFGNHDDQDFIANYPNGSTAQHPALYLRHALAVSDRRHRHSLTPIGPNNVFGVSNGILSVFDPTDGSLAFQVVLLDSGGGSLEQQIVENQMEWYQSHRSLQVPAVAFQHIPTDQFLFVEDDTMDDTSSLVCSGFNGEQGIAPLHNDPTREIARLAQMDTNLLVLAVGHNHGNSYCCEPEFTSKTTPNNAPVLCFGRHSGYGGYGTWTRGARVYTFTWDKNSTKLSSWNTYVRLQDGNTTDHYEPRRN